LGEGGDSVHIGHARSLMLRVLLVRYLADGNE
jgi:cysteinyl-tRNA synthetase